MCAHRNGWLLTWEAASCVLLRKKPSMVSMVGNSNNEHVRCKQRRLGPNSLTYANCNAFRLCHAHPANSPFTGHCQRYIRRQSGRAPRSKWIYRIKWFLWDESLWKMMRWPYLCYVRIVRKAVRVTSKTIWGILRAREPIQASGRARSIFSDSQ